MKAEGAALVTGAGRGLGRALAVELARRGFDVVATMRDLAKGDALLAAAGPARARLRLAHLDVTDAADFRMPEGLRVLVNNAGVDVDYLPVEHAPLEMWRTVFETNLLGLVMVTRLAIPRLREAGGGVICNVTSASLLFPMPFYAAYRASKAAVSALGESLRAELAPFGIRVLEVLPGPIDTDMLAASHRVPEAARYEGYRELAERAHAGRKQVESAISPAARSAERIVDAILDDSSPLRCASDDLGAGLLAGWRQAADEDWLRSLLEAFTKRRE